MGCHHDMGNPGGTNGRDLSGLYFSVEKMTNDFCVEVCAASGFAYAGTQYGQSCFCGNSYGSRGPATNCNVPCPGNPCEACGGAWANSVYATDGGAG